MKRILFPGFLFCSFCVSAQQTDSIDLLPVEVKTIRASATAPFAKTNLSLGEIRRANLGQDLPYVLQQTPSVVVNSDAGNGIGYTGIRIRGSDATRINVTINGIPFNDPESGGAFFVNLPDILSSAGSIQIQRGVGTSSNGAGAFGGTINLSTNEPNKQAYFESNNSYGSFYSAKNTLRFGSGLVGNHLTTDVRLSRISSNGYIERARTNLKSHYLSTAYITDKTTLRFTSFSGKEKTYQAWNGVSETDLKTNRRMNSAGTERPGEPYPNETDNYDQDHYQLFFTQKPAKHFTFNTGLFYIKGKGFYEQYKAAQKYSNYGLPNVIYGNTEIQRTDLVRQLWLDNDFFGNIFSLQYAKSGAELTLGGAITNYRGNHFGRVTWADRGLTQPNKIWYDNNAEKSDWNVYGKWQQSLTKHFQFFADLQVRKVSYTIDGFRNNPSLQIAESYSFFNPKAGLSYQAGDWKAFASYSIGNREPVRDDFEASPADLPKPEHLQDIEAGTEWKNKRVAVGATVYYMKYRDQLVLTGKINDVGAYTRTNIGNSYRLGLELQASATPAAWLRASGNLTLSRNKIEDLREYIDDYDNGGQKTYVYRESDISYSPAVTGAATLTLIPFQKLSIDLLGKYVGQQYLDNTGSKVRKLKAFYTQDLRAVYAVQKAWIKNVDIIVQVANVFNKRYEPNGYTFSYFYNNELATENYYFPMAGINWMAGLNIRL